MASIASLFSIRIMKACVYHDIFSVFKELGKEATGSIKPKLKLFLKKDSVLEQWIFINSTSKKYGWDKSYTIKIGAADWEEVDQKWITNEITHLCVRNIDVLTTDDLRLKCEDENNKFLKAGKIKDSDYQLLKEKYKESREKLERSAPAIASAMDFALLDININDEAIKALKALNLY